MDWFLDDNGLRLERVKGIKLHGYLILDWKKNYILQVFNFAEKHFTGI